MKRELGILLPIFSLPNRYLIGNFGKEAYEFIDYLNEAGVEVWQLLPLNPTSYGDSPYQAYSSFAFNPYFIDLDNLKELSLLTEEEIKPLISISNHVEYGVLFKNFYNVIRIAYNRNKDLNVFNINNFKKNLSQDLKNYFEFMTLKVNFNFSSFLSWPSEYSNHKKSAIKEFVKLHEDDYNFFVFIELVLEIQYKKLKDYAKAKNVKILGDLPIYVALDSSDVWANRSLFKFKNNKPSKVAGVPPDYFSPDGQLWGNPIYNYKKMEKDNFFFWKRRIEKCKEIYDLLRLDHFRGFESFYEIDYGAKNAKVGHWKKGPGLKLINVIKKAAGKMKIIAEDLGQLTKAVYKLKKDANLCGLNIYQFGYSLEDKHFKSSYLPQNYKVKSVAYLGTHDNMTTNEFLSTVSEPLKEHIFKDLKVNNIKDAQEEMLKRIVLSKSKLVILTLQDLLFGGKEGRINTPGVASNNWIYATTHLYKDKTFDYLNYLRKISKR